MKPTGLTALMLMAVSTVVVDCFGATDAPDEVKAAIASPYFPISAGGGVLVWGGGASGTWDDATPNWYTESCEASAWVSGATAVFPVSATITVSGTKEVAGLLNVVSAERVTFTGDALTFTTAETVRFGADGVFRFENAIDGSAGYSQSIGESADAVQKLDESVYLVSTEARKVLPSTVKLANIETFSLIVQGCWGSAQTPVKLTNAKVEAQNGLYNWTYDEETKSVTFIVKYMVYDGLGGIVEAVKVKLEEGDDGIYASVIYTKAAIGSYDLTHGESTTWDCDFDAYNFRADCQVYDSGTALDNYKLYVYDFECSLKGAIPTEMGVEIAGDCFVTGDYALNSGSFRIVESGALGGGAFKEAVSVASGVLLEFAGTAAINVAGKITTAGSGYVLVSGEGISFSADQSSSWDLRISGKASSTGYRTLPTDGSIKVLSDGELSIGSCYYEWGPDGGRTPIYIYKDGTVRLVKPDAMGVWKHWYLYGGTVTNENTSSSYPLVYNLHLLDGATFTGSRVGVGYTTYYDTWSSVAVSGTKPSVFAVDDLMVGYQYPATKEGQKVGVKFDVADVTGDDGVDFTLQSPIVDREGVVLYKDAGLRENCGVWKTGAGTMLLTASTHNEPQGVFKIDAGTVRFGATSAGQLGALLVAGDAALEVEEGGTIAFADSSAVEWTEGKTLTLKSKVGKMSLRFGESATGLSADQLAAICYDASVTTKKPVFALTSSGYLTDGLSGGFCIRIR